MRSGRDPGETGGPERIGSQTIQSGRVLLRYRSGWQSAQAQR